jgi:hypothetical protein
MNLSSDQLRSLEHGDPVRVNEAGIDCILVRADVFDQIKRALSFDEWSDDEMRAIAERTFDDADSAGPIQ